MAIAYPAGRLYVVEYETESDDGLLIKYQHVAAYTATEAVEELLIAGLIKNRKQIVQITIEARDIIIQVQRRRPIP